jgi:hypothetical protein
MTEPTNPGTPAQPPEPTPDPIHESTTTAVPTTPVTPPPVEPAIAPPVQPATATGAEVAPAAVAVTAVETAPVGRSRARWGIALGLVAVVIAVTAAITLALTGASPTATVLGYVPADSVMYGEVRLDLPGDQRREVGEFLSHFPGFADQAALDTKLDEVLDRLVAEGTDGKQTFTKDIKPWFDGEMAFAMGPLPSVAPASGAEHMADARGLLLLSLKDEALARAWFAEAMSSKGITGTTESYGGEELTVFASGDGSKPAGAFAIVDGKVAIAGDLASVKAAIDTEGSGGLADEDDFKAAMSAAENDHIGFAYVDMRSLMDSAMAMAGSVGGANAPAISEDLLGMVPDWASFRLRVEGDALVMDGAMPHAATAPGPDSNHANGVPAWAPPTTVALFAGNDAGATIQEAVDLYRKDPNLKDVFTQLDGAVGVLGGLESAIGWMGDTGVVVARTGDTVEGGLIVIPTDAAKGQQLLTTIRSFATLGGAQAGVTVRDEEHNGTTITIVNVGDAGAMLGMAGMMGIAPVPGGGANLPGGDIEIAWAATDGVVVVGSGPEFVKHVLDAGAGDSLADDDRFEGLVSRVGNEHTGLAFVDVAGFRALAEDAMADAPATDRAEYEESVKPFLEPFDAFVSAAVTGGDLDEQHALITVK